MILLCNIELKSNGIQDKFGTPRLHDQDSSILPTAELCVNCRPLVFSGTSIKLANLDNKMNACRFCTLSSKPSQRHRHI